MPEGALYVGLIALLLLFAKAMGTAAKAIGQPAVLGELIAGVIVGASVLGWVDAHDHVLHVIAELGVIVLLFEIGLETDLEKLLKVGWEALLVAVVGVIVPFVLGYAVCLGLGYGNMVGIVAGATLTATSVGITARVLADLGRLQEPESQIVLGAAVIDDVIGLIILAVVSGLTEGKEVTLLSVGVTTGIACGFLVATLIIGSWILPPIVQSFVRWQLAGTPTMLALIVAMALAWLAAYCGLAPLVGAFAAGLLIRKVPQEREIEMGVAHIGAFFVPIFFLMVGAAVNVSTLNPFNMDNSKILMMAGCLLGVAIVGKFVAGYAPLWFRGKKHVIGIGMIPRGEVGLIFANMGLATKVFDEGLFSAVTVTVMATTFIAPFFLKWTFPAKPHGKEESQGIEVLLNEP